MRVLNALKIFDECINKIGSSLNVNFEYGQGAKLKRDGAIPVQRTPLVASEHSFLWSLNANLTIIVVFLNPCHFFLFCY